MIDREHVFGLRNEAGGKGGRAEDIARGRAWEGRGARCFPEVGARCAREGSRRGGGEGDDSRGWNSPTEGGWLGSPGVSLSPPRVAMPSTSPSDERTCNTTTLLRHYLCLSTWFLTALAYTLSFPIFSSPSRTTFAHPHSRGSPSSPAFILLLHPDRDDSSPHELSSLYPSF